MMNWSKNTLIALLLLLALLLSAGAALAQQNALSVRVTCATGTSISIAWNDVAGESPYTVIWENVTGTFNTGNVPGLTETTYTLASLANAATEYTIIVSGTQTATQTITGSTAAASVTECTPSTPSTPSPPSSSSSGKMKGKTVKEVAPEPTPRPLVNPCPHLPAEYEVYEYAAYATQCRVVGAGGIGRADLIQQGIIGAVDIWGIMPGGGVDVCIHGHGPMVFLDAAYSPRQLVDPVAEIREGMTCTRIERAGTVILLIPAPGGAMSMETESPPPAPAPVAPVEVCRIRVTESLFLRAEPAGEIIGGVWAGSELTVLEVSGHWYKVGVDGATGYISRYYREVLSGNC